MFAKLFKPKWQVGTTEQRLAAIEKFNPEVVKEKTALLRIVSDDQEPRVRAAAVKRFEDRSLLEQLLRDTQSEDTKEAIQRQMINTYSEGCLAGLDQSQLLDVALQHKQARLRLAAAEQITKGGLLDVLAREAKDKAVQRHVRNALKSVKEARAEEQAKSAAIDSLCETLEGLAGRGSIDQFFLAKYEKAEQQWNQLETQPSEQQKQRWDAAVTACAADFEELKSAQEAERKKAKAEKDVQSLVEQVEAQAASLSQKAPQADIIQGLLNMTGDSWQAIQKLVKPTAEQAKRYNAARKQLEQYCVTLTELHTHEEALKAAINEIELFDGKKPADIIALRDKYQAQRERIQWPKGVASPALLAHWEQACFKLDQLKRDIEANEDEAIRVLMRKRRQLDVHVEKGDLKIANRIHAQIHHSLDQLWGRELERQQQRLQPLEEKLQKLRDWQDYSTEPKKEELCSQMEALIAQTEMDPLDKAEAIKALQEEWRETTAVNIKEDDPLWTRFQESGNKAYEPCTEYYAKLGEIKQENLQKRRDLVQQLDDYFHAVDWEKADWKKLQTVLRTARNEWKQYEPVRFPDAKPVHQAFFDLVDKINDKLKGHWQGNLEAKEELIKKAQELAELEDLPQAIEKAIFLQKQWKDAGHTFRSREQKLWKNFRAACDAVFARRDAERKAERAETDGHIQRAEALVEQMKGLANLDDVELLKSGDQAEALQAEFAEIELPEKVAKAIGGKFNDARRSYEQQVDGIAERKRSASLDQLAKAAAFCDQAETVVQQGSADAEQLKTDWATYADSLAEADLSAIQPRIDAVLEAATGNPSALGDLAANADSLAQLAIELEVLTDVETPEDYRGERRAYQLDKMADGLGGAKDIAEQQQELVLLRKRWYLTGAVDTAQRESLQSRLAKVLAA